MKSNKGITLISLIVYVIAMLIVVTIIGTITSFFYANVNNEYAQNKDDYKNVNLEMYLEKDLKNKEIWLTNINGENITSGTNVNTIKFIYDDLYSITYSIKNDGIYRNSIKIYDTADAMHFEITDVPSNSESIIQDKQEIKIVKDDSTVFKLYTVNVPSKANFPTPTPTPTPTVTP